jgi:hypothetical protein
MADAAGAARASPPADARGAAGAADGPGGSPAAGGGVARAPAAPGGGSDGAGSGARGGSKQRVAAKYTKSMSLKVAELVQALVARDGSFKTRRPTVPELREMSDALAAALPESDAAHCELARNLTRLRTVVNQQRERLQLRVPKTKKATRNAKKGLVKKAPKPPPKPKPTAAEKEAAVQRRAATEAAEAAAAAAVATAAAVLVARWRDELQPAAAPYAAGDSVVTDDTSAAVAQLVERVHALRAEASCMHGAPAAIEAAVAAERALGAMAHRNPAEGWAARLLAGRTVSTAAPHVHPLQAAAKAQPPRAKPAPPPRRRKADVPPAGRPANRAVRNALSSAVADAHLAVLKGSAAGAGVLSSERAGAAAAAFAARAAAAGGATAAAAAPSDAAAAAAAPPPAVDPAAYAPPSLAGGAAFFFHLGPDGTPTFHGENFPASALPALRELMCGLAGAPARGESEWARERRLRRPTAPAQLDAAVADADARAAALARAPDAVPHESEAVCRFCRVSGATTLTKCAATSCPLYYHHMCAGAEGWDHTSRCCAQCALE